MAARCRSSAAIGIGPRSRPVSRPDAGKAPGFCLDHVLEVGTAEGALLLQVDANFFQGVIRQPEVSPFVQTNLSGLACWLRSSG